MKNQKKNQAQPFSRTSEILAHLKRERNGITALEALGVYGVFRLASTIHRLRERGYAIVTERCFDLRGHEYGRYRLVRS
jgi:hypothetical protein